MKKSSINVLSIHDEGERSIHINEELFFREGETTADELIVRMTRLGLIPVPDRMDLTLGNGTYFIERSGNIDEDGE